jgi:CoA:oxalate CoA-transferase
VPGRIGTRHPLIVPFQAFPTSDGFVVVAGVRDRDWALFCALVGVDELIADPRYQTNVDRRTHHAELEPVLNEAFKKKTTAEWLSVLSDSILIAPLQTIDQMVKDPQVLARNMFVDLPSWKGRDFRVVNSPIKLSRTPVTLTKGADSPGGHTRQILESALGMTDAEIETLLEAKVLGEGDPSYTP